MNFISTKITMNVRSFRRIENPFEQEGKKMYQVILQIKQLPEELENWKQINPRHPNTSSGVAKKIAQSLEEQPDFFLFKNRGITLLVERVGFDNSKNQLSIELSDKSIHGLLDGGHTYAVIRELLESLTEDATASTYLDRAFVKVEILEGFSSKEDVAEIVGSRNTSTQVKDQSLADLRKQFDGIKEVLALQPYAQRIAYKETEFDDDGSKKDIDIKDVLSYLICFDIEEFTRDKHPIVAYSGKSSVLKHVLDHSERLEKYFPLLPKILELKDEIYEQMPSAWNSDNRRFGRISGVTVKKTKTVELPFKGSYTEYVISHSFIYPVLASFRNLIEIRGDKCSWKRDPIRFFDEYKNILVKRLREHYDVYENPNKLGKEKTVWQACFDCVYMECLTLGL